MPRTTGSKNKPGHKAGGLRKRSGRPKTVYQRNSNLFHYVRNTDRDEINEENLANTHEIKLRPRSQFYLIYIAQNWDLGLNFTKYASSRDLGLE